MRDVKKIDNFYYCIFALMRLFSREIKFIKEKENVERRFAKGLKRIHAG